MRTVQQHSENIMAAQPLIGMKPNTPQQLESTENCGCDKHVKQAAIILPHGQKVGKFNVNL